MKTRTAPWDYQRQTQYVDDDELAHMNELKDRLAQAKRSLIEIIGQREYMYFEIDLPIEIQTNTRLLLLEIQHELDRYECSCTPVHEPCNGCQNLVVARSKNITERSGLSQPT